MLVIKSTPIEDSECATWNSDLCRSARQRQLNGPLQYIDGGWLRDAGHDRFSFDNHLPRIRMPRDQDHRDPAFGDDLGRREAINDRHVEIDECNIDLVVVA